MKTIYCVECANCDLKNDRCKLYGSDPIKAVHACATNNFRQFRKIKKTVAEPTNTHDQPTV